MHTLRYFYLGSAAILVAVAANLIHSPTAIAEWIRIKTDERQNIYYVDTTTIETKGSQRYFWSYIVFGTPYEHENKLVYSSAYYLSVNCQEQLFNLHFKELLDENRQVIKEYDYSDSVAGAPTPGSSEEASLKFVCSR
jgi:hypothetical protein